MGKESKTSVQNKTALLEMRCCEKEPVPEIIKLTTTALRTLLSINSILTQKATLSPSNPFLGRSVFRNKILSAALIRRSASFYNGGLNEDSFY